MITFLSEAEEVRIPGSVVDLRSFRRWTDTDDFPETGRIWYLKGEVWVDMSKEQVFTHLGLKNECSFVLTGLVKAGLGGRFFPDGLFLTCLDADIAGQPDGTFVSFESLRTGRVRLIEGVEGGFVELEGSPDMVLEVVSRSSVRKDTVLLREAYWEAGVREYWLMDARRSPLRFDILRHTPKGYVRTRAQGGWMRSVVFGKSFRLSQSTGTDGYPLFTLATR